MVGEASDAVSAWTQASLSDAPRLLMLMATESPRVRIRLLPQQRPQHWQHHVIPRESCAYLRICNILKTTRLQGTSAMMEHAGVSESWRKEAAENAPRLAKKTETLAKQRPTFQGQSLDNPPTHLSIAQDVPYHRYSPLSPRERHEEHLQVTCVSKCAPRSPTSPPLAFSCGREVGERRCPCARFCTAVPHRKH